MSTISPEETRELFEAYRARCVSEAASPAQPYQRDPETLILLSDAFMAVVALSAIYRRADVEADTNTLVKVAAAAVPCSVEDMQLAVDTMTAGAPLEAWVDAACINETPGVQSSIAFARDGKGDSPGVGDAPNNERSDDRPAA